MWILIGLTMGMLTVCTVTDLKKREIAAIPILAATLIGFFYRGITGSFWQGFTELGLRFLPGGVFLLIGRWKRDAVGLGDGILLLATGYLLGARLQCSLLMAALAASGLWAGALLLLRKKKWNDTLPFAPFLLLGNLAILIGKGIEVLFDGGRITGLP